MPRATKYSGLKIAHVVKPIRYTDFAYYQFEAVAPGASDYYVVGGSGEGSRIKDCPAKDVRVKDILTGQFINALEKYDLVIFHSLGFWHKFILAHLSRSVRCVWIGMGFDYYDLIYSTDEYYMPRTLEVMQSLGSERTLATKAKSVAKEKIAKGFTESDALRKVAVFAPVLEQEYDRISRNTNGPIAPFVEWAYGRTAEIFRGNIAAVERDGGKVLVGSTDHPNTNHLDAFESLSNAGVSLNDLSVLVPLSGPNSKYKDIVRTDGEKRFPGRVAFIDQFLEHDRFMNVLTPCQSVVMPHLRQQAGGVILRMLYRGARVFLNPGNPFYEFLQSRGAYVSSIHEIARTSNSIREPIPHSEWRQNREFIIEHQSPEKNWQRTTSLIEVALR